MNESSVILASGIIVERSQDVISAFDEHGFKVVERIDENGWCALAVMKK
jgi:ribosomal protein L11 methylase PrmA